MKEELLDFINKNKKDNTFAQKLVEYLKLNLVDKKDEYCGVKLDENALIFLAGKNGEIKECEALIHLLSV
jgi:hypothetical protein